MYNKYYPRDPNYGKVPEYKSVFKMYSELEVSEVQTVVYTRFTYVYGAKIFHNFGQTQDVKKSPMEVLRSF